MHGLFKREFAETRAADDVSFDIAEGEFVGFLGPNGAGKTTTLKMLSGLIYPTSGTARVAGFNPSKRENAYRRIFALVLGQKTSSGGTCRPSSRSCSCATSTASPPPTTSRRSTSSSTCSACAPSLNVMVRELSLGERMKMELIAALLHRPRVLFLDEPTIGLDVISQKAVRQFLRDYNRRHRVTILLTSHYMADIKDGERVIVIHQGKKIYDGQLDRLESGPGSRKKIIRFVPQDGSFSETWQSRYGETKYDAQEGKFTVRMPGENVVAVSQEILTAGQVADITIEDVPLEDIIAEFFKQHDS